jgi:hypothetical protein
MQPPEARFLERFARFGSAPSVETYLPLFHPRATLFDSGMARPIAVPEIPEHIEAILKVVPDFRMTPERWRRRDATLFVEASNEATLAGRRARWPSVYCMDLRGDRVIRGRRYYDRQPLYAHLNPDLPALPRLESGTVDIAPGASPFRRALEPLVPALSFELLQEAGDDELRFAEWRATGTLAGAALAIGGVDRFEAGRGPVHGARAYFDTLELAGRLADAAPHGPRRAR